MILRRIAKFVSIPLGLGCVCFGVQYGVAQSQTNGVFMMSIDQIRRQLALSTNEYAVILAKTKEAVVDPIQSVLPRHELARVLLMDAGLEEQNFVVASQKDTLQVTILTESLDNLNALLQKEDLVFTNDVQALSFVKEIMQLVRPLYKNFRIVEDRKECKLFSDNIRKTGGAMSVQPPSVMQVKAGHFNCTLWVILGNDLYRREVVVTGKKIVFDDQLLVPAVVSPTNPHT